MPKKPIQWEIYRPIKGSPGAFIGIVEAPDETSALKTAIAIASYRLTLRTAGWRALAYRKSYAGGAGEIARLRDAAQRLMRTAWAQQRIRLIAAALVQHGTLSGEGNLICHDRRCAPCRDRRALARPRRCHRRRGFWRAALCGR